MLIINLLKEKQHICIGKDLTRLVILANLELLPN